MWSYWAAVIREAIAGTKASFGLNRRLVINAITFVLALLLLVVVAGPTDDGQRQVFEELRWGLAVLGALIVTIIGAFLVNLVAVPPRMAERDREAPWLVPAPQLPEDPHQRTHVDVTTDFLVNLYHNRLDVHADRLAQDYLGKWMKISGRFKNLSSHVGASWLVHLEPSRPDVFPAPGFFVVRDQAWVERITVMEQGRYITLLGQITGISRHAVDLDHCEVVTRADRRRALQALVTTGRELRDRWTVRAKVAVPRQLGEPRAIHEDDGREEQWYCEVSAVLEGDPHAQALWREFPEDAWKDVGHSDEAYAARRLQLYVANLERVLSDG